MSVPRSAILALAFAGGVDGTTWGNKCSGSADPAVTGPQCYSGSAGALGVTESINVKIHDFSAGSGHMELTGGGVQHLSCSTHSFAKSGQSISVDLSDCLPSFVTVSSVKYCSDQDSIKVTVKDTNLPIPITAKASRVDCADGSTRINDFNRIAQYNSRNGATWVAGHNEFFGDMTIKDARILLGAQLTDIAEHLDATLSDSVYAALGEVPADFDASTEWAELIHPIRNQQRCGSCWAFSASEVMSDRVAIATRKTSPVLSAEDMVSCDTGDYGCQGGMLNSAWDYITNTGLLTDSCFPYSAGGGNAPACESKCADGSSFTRTKSTSAYAIKGVANIQKDLMTNGPIQVAFKVYNSFFSYKSGVYSKLSSEYYPEGGHAVKFTGWGTEDGSDYWLVANSWGTNWGLEGFFKIERGSDACGIETMGPPYAGHAAASSSVVV